MMNERAADAILDLVDADRLARGDAEYCSHREWFMGISKGCDNPATHEVDGRGYCPDHEPRPATP